MTYNKTYDLDIAELEKDIYSLFGKGTVLYQFRECLRCAEEQNRGQLAENTTGLMRAKEQFLNSQVFYSAELALRCERLMQEVLKLLDNIMKNGGPVTNKVFIVHGRNTEMKKEIKSYFYEIGFDPVILSEQVNGGKTVIEKFEEYAEQAAFAVILLSPDDEGGLRGQHVWRPRARQNVILELGYFIGKLGRPRILIFRPEEEDLEEPSDISGYCFIPYDAMGKWKLATAQNIAGLGYSIDLNRIQF